MAKVSLAPPIEKTIGGVLIRIERRDLTAMPVDGIVFYAKESLELGSGFGAAIGTRGGDAVRKELATMGSVQMGEAVVTSGGKLAARYIIHACGPKFQEADLEGKFRRAVRSALSAAEGRGMKHIALPPMGAGFYGIPLGQCARWMLDSIGAFCRRGTSIREITICLMDQREFAAFEQELRSL